MKTPEQYFVEDVRLPDVDDAGRALTSAEQAFLDKYLGVEQQAKVLAKAQRIDPRGEDVVAGLGPDAASQGAERANDRSDEHSDERMRNQAEIRPRLRPLWPGSSTCVAG